MIFVLFFVRVIFKMVFMLRAVLILAVVFSILVSFNIIKIFGSNPSSSTQKSNGITIVPCTSTANSKPQMPTGWKSTIYSGAMGPTSPDISAANNVRTFSYASIKSKTDANSLYSRIEKSDSSYITGYGTTMEVCDNNNMTSSAYATANNDNVASENTVASTHYLHGGNYLHGTGDYRIDVYLRSPDSKWTLIDRMDKITITE